MKSWVEISRQQLLNNFLALQRIATAEGGDPGAVAVLAVIKANAYGHGIVPCAAALAEAGAEWLGVTDACEGAAVREALAASGIAKDMQPKILVMSGTAGLPGEAENIVRHRLIPVVWNRNHLARLVSSAANLTTPLEVHLEIDTGMSRQGATPGRDLRVLLAAISGERCLELSGVMTHFASTEVAHSKQTFAQQERFEAALAQVAAARMKPGWIHVGNSSYVDNFVEEVSPLRWLSELAKRFDAKAMVRSGLALYGYLLPIEGAGKSLAGPAVYPVMTWKTSVIGLSDVEAGAAVGYGATFVASRPMRLALLPVGYADGLRRELSSTASKGGGWVMIRGQRAQIVGRVSMNLTTVDVSGIDGVHEGDEAVLLGEGITADEHAMLAETIAYEILCGVRTSG